ncbi:MAG TPA: formate--tetrahydrofolate ligase [Thermoplasmata archaeon]|nr:formate--tetrahydrofolate ligase [Thermoplasmata archaeon]
MRTLADLARALGLDPNEVHPAGASAGKVPVSVVRERAARPHRGKLVLVTAVTPTRHGEGKTVTVIGLANAFQKIGHRPVACLRQPSLGPTFGIKGGATGGGRATVEPAADINLGFTGDIHAVAAAHNLLAALIDNHIFHGNALEIDAARIVWSRTMDNEDRALRRITVGKGPDPRSAVHESSFCITAASEVMAILALARDYADLKDRLGRILIGYARSGAAVRASDLKAAGAMAAILRDALEPNLVQTSEGVPALVHAGPFGNIAHGTCSRLSIELGLATSDYCVVEAGFATELGAEKFVDIVTPVLGVPVDAAVLVATQRSLRYQGGATEAESVQPAPGALERGLESLDQHLRNLEALGLASVVALNAFPGDSTEESELIRSFCRSHGVEVVESKSFEFGGDGAIDLARAVEHVASLGRKSHPLYRAGTSPLRQVETIATRLYGAEGTRQLPEAMDDLALLQRIDELAGPVCVAKTPLSLSDDPKILNRPPKGYRVTIDRFTRSAGAGFTVAHLGSIELMPGLPTHPASETIDVTPDGQVVGVH